ncbi:MAG: nuclear transport factor 2 family protein [Rhizobiaceae bacterium]
MSEVENDLSTLRALNARFIHNFITCDVASHSEIIHPRFMCISTNGSKQGRADYLHDWATDFDPDVIIYWDTRAEQIDIFGDVALVRATNKYVRHIEGKDITGMTTYTDIYIREGGKWLCIQAQLTSVTPDNYPNDSSIISTYIRGKLQS